MRTACFSLRWLTLALSIGSVGCLQASGAPEADERFPEPRLDPLRGTLTRATSCDDLREKLRADAITGIDLQAWRLAESYVEPEGDAGGWYGGAVDAGTFLPTPTTGAPLPPAGEGDGAPRHTETNTQIEGIDEADFVETDGTHVYLLHDRTFFVLDAAPLGTIDEAAKVEIEGAPSAMFVANGRAVIFSVLSPYSYGGFPYPPPLDPGLPIEPALDGGVAMGWEGGAPEAPLDAGSPAPIEPPGPIPPPYWHGTPQTAEVKVTVLDLSAATPVVVSERYLEGSYVDARREGDVVRLVVQSYAGAIALPSVPYGWDASTGRGLSREGYLDALAAWRDAARAIVEAAPIEAFVPGEQVLVEGARTDVPLGCTDVYLPPPGETAPGTSAVLTFSIASPAGAHRIAISGRADVVYANGDVLALASHDYRWDELTGVADQSSALHLFALDGLATEHLASGVIPGSVRDRFSLDERAGVLRVVSTEQRPLGEVTLDPRVNWIPTEGVTHVTTLRPQQGALAVLGVTPDLAPGETVQAVRFLGERAYVVTFRQVDPLFVVDLADPARPTVLGELTIPGFSTYVHPLDENHLLTIGQAVPVNGVGAWGLTLQIFDVTEPSAPSQLHAYVIEDGSSTAQYDPHAFTFDAETGILAIPVTRYGASYESNLSLFDVSVGGGIVPRGTIVHTAYFQGCGDPYSGVYACAYAADVRRGLFLGDYVYTVSYRAVTAHLLSELATPSDTYVLPAPISTYYGFYPY